MAGNAPDALLHTVGHDSSAAPRRIALFSLGNFAGCDLVAGTLPLFIATVTAATTNANAAALRCTSTLHCAALRCVALSLRCAARPRCTALALLQLHDG